MLPTSTCDEHSTGRPSGCKPLVHLQCALPSRTLHCREHDCMPADSQWQQDGEGCEKQHTSKTRVTESLVQGCARRQRGPRARRCGSWCLIAKVPSAVAGLRSATA